MHLIYLYQPKTPSVIMKQSLLNRNQEKYILLISILKSRKNRISYFKYIEQILKLRKFKFDDQY